MDELFELEPGVRQHFVGLVLADLKEAIAQGEDSRYAHATVALVERIENDWRQKA